MARGHILRLRCGRCGRTSALLIEAVAERYRIHEETRLSELWPRLRCMRCGAGEPEWDAVDPMQTRTWDRGPMGGR